MQKKKKKKKTKEEILVWKGNKQLCMIREKADFKVRNLSDVI